MLLGGGEVGGDARLVREALQDTESESAGFELEWIDRLQPGLNYIRENRPDLVLLDLSLPDTQGLTTIKSSGPA